MIPGMVSTPTGVLTEDDSVDQLEASLPNNHEQITAPKPTREYKIQLVWESIIFYPYIHLAALYGAYLALTSAKLSTNIWAFLLYFASGFGVTAGAHRLWTHRSYKAKWPLRVILIIFNSIAFQHNVYNWSRDHRVHHKYTETNADPHNAKRGFFFSHIGWLLCRKHPDVIEKGKEIDLSDLEEDPIVVFQKKYYSIMMPLLCFIIPTVVPVYFWGESWSNAWHIAAIFRYTFFLNITWLVNSAAHMWGDKPYDRYINPCENKGVAFATLGEGWHNYHHVFPWDYKTAELGDYSLNPTTAFIDFFTKIGWAYDLKTVSAEMVKKRVERTGDGSHPVWGWGDKDITKQDIDTAVVINKKDD
ncbi:acyl-CoA Delta-9 desaturase-like [Planococcus citri]|uniref:acyl-CoA Delta-9 desaturase-like n=1 Tax=Planococcus citri TaxID=170843 RepID=UPI0031F7E59C